MSLYKTSGEKSIEIRPGKDSLFTRRELPKDAIVLCKDDCWNCKCRFRKARCNIIRESYSRSIDNILSEIDKIFQEYSIVYHRLLVRELAKRLSITEIDVVKIVSFLEQQNLIRYSGNLMKVEENLMARQAKLVLRKIDD